MPVPEIRPTFEVSLPVSADHAIEEMRARLHDHFRECTMSAGRCVDLYVPREQRHFWSPHLSVQVREAEAGSQLHGRFGPHPEVWTLFVFLYALVGFAALGGAGWAYAQWLLGRPPWALALIPASAAAGALLYGGSRIGQRLGRHQMAELRSRLEAMIAGIG